MKRVQIKRRKGARLPYNTRKVDRSTAWGNPFPPGSPVKPDDPYCQEVVEDQESSIALFRQYALRKISSDPLWITPLLSYDNLACWCPPGVPCHADILIEIINGMRNGEL